MLATKCASAPSTSGVSWTTSKRGSGALRRVAAGEAVRQRRLALGTAR